MSQVSIEKVNDASQKTLPIFAEISKRIGAVRQRAFELFEKRGREAGHDVEDWLEAEREFIGSPAAELTEKDGAYQVKITLPGFEAKDIEVTATPSEILVHAATKQETKEEKNNILWTEFGSNDLYRRFEVPSPLNVDEVTANFGNGVLRINAPELAKPKEIAAKAA